MSAGTHGLSGDTARRDWPRLTPQKLAPILACYPGLGGTPKITWHSQRPFAASALVETPDARIFVKRHDTRVRTVPDLLEEHEFIDHLRNNGAAIPEILRNDRRTSAHEAADGIYELHARGAGRDLYRNAHSWTPVRSTEHAFALGETLASLHLAAADFTRPARKTHLLKAADTLLRAVDPVATLQKNLALNPSLQDALATRPWREDFQRVILPWHEALRPHVPAMPPLWVHGDFHASNALWRNGHVSSVLDFGMCDRTSALFDLATAIERNTIAWLDITAKRDDIGRPDLARALVAGYSHLHASPTHIQPALKHILPLVHIDFALSEIAYFHAVTRSAENTEIAYTDFLLGHAAWFATPPGQSFLAGALPCA